MKLLLIILLLFVFIYSLSQIITFYNIQINFFGVYASFYIFMAFCVWMFNDQETIDKLEGMIVEINLNSGVGKKINKVIHSNKGDMIMTSV